MYFDVTRILDLLVLQSNERRISISHGHQWSSLSQRASATSNFYQISHVMDIASALSYEYKPLRDARKTRLLQMVLNGDEEGQVYYDIVVVDLDDQPSFYALSYTWGCPFADDDSSAQQHWPTTRSNLILGDGRCVKVGHNLCRALTCLKELGVVGHLWIDAICINQSDIQERNAQVAMMGDIYAAADKVLVWLGDENWSSKVAMVFLDGFLPRMEKLIEDEGRDPTFSYSFTDPRLYERLGEPEFPQEVFDGLAAFLERSWFGRAWTYQETVLARNIDVFCGSRKISWPRLHKLLKLLETSDWDFRLSRFQISSKVQQIPGKMILSTMWQRDHIARGGPRELGYQTYLKRIASGGKRVDLLMAYLDHLLYGMRCRKATDNRDHLFAIYGIVARLSHDLGIENILPKPDYTQDIIEVSIAYSRAMLAHSRTLLLLSNVEDRSSSDNNWPSWVPDLSRDWVVGLPRSGSGDYYDTPKGMGPRILPSPKPEILMLEGYSFDTIQALGEHDFELGQGSVPFTKTAQIILNLPSHYPTGQDRAEVLWRTLIADQAQGECPAPHSTGAAFFEHMLMHNSMAMLNSEKAHQSKGLEGFAPLARLAASTAEAAKVIPSGGQILQRRNIYAEIQALTQKRNGRNGLSPEQEEHLQKRVRDVLSEEAKAVPFARQLATLFVSKRIVTTRAGFIGAVPTSSRIGDAVFVLPGARVPFILRKRDDGTYRLLGECYVHGIMQGEAFDHKAMVAEEIALA